MANTFTRRHFLSQSGLLVGGAIAGPSLLSACGGAPGGGDSDTFRVGAVLEMSGESATGGQIARRGYEMWVKTVNQQGGISIGGQRYRVELIVQDCQSQPSVGADATARLVTEEGVDAIFGAYTSGVQIAMNPICEKYRVPCIAGSAESPENWTAKPAFTYGIIPAVDTTAARSIQAIVDTASPAPTSAAVLGANEPFSDDTAIGFRAGAQAAGLDVTHYSLFPIDADLTPVANVAAETNPDMVAVGGHDVLLVDFVKALASVDYTPKAIIEHYGITDASFAKALGKDAEGVMGITVWLPDSPDQDDVFGTASEYAQAFEDRYGTPPDYTAAGCSVAGEVLQLALEQLGERPSLSEGARTSLNDILAKTSADTFYGPIEFASSGDHFHNNTALDPILVQIQDGQVKAIAPEASAQAEMVYPLVPWADR
ncbi:MAG: amino acid ABC transporter substrate-binding protein [Nocardioidaceae bacterium]